MDYNAPLYQHKQEVWDEAKCKKAAKHIASDGMGTKYPFRGFIGPFTAYDHYGVTRYNGGCERDGEWRQGEFRPLPQVHQDYEIVHRSSWGYVIQRKT